MINEIVIYITEFHRKKLKKYPDCKRYYDTMPVADLVSEALWLLGDATKGLPFPLIFYRCYALFDEMTERATCWKGFNDSERVKFINATIDVKEEMLRRAAPSVREELAQQFHRTCKRIKKMGRYKKACDMVRDYIRDYAGPFGPKHIVVIHPGNRKMH